MSYTDYGADLLVDFQLEIERKSGVVSTTPATESIWSFHSSGSYQVQVSQREQRTFEVGRLAIILSDPEKGSDVWRGEFVGRLRKFFVLDLEEALSSLLGRLPPVPRKPGETPEVVPPRSQSRLARR